jgi:RimJ/RimL family protein N-acetyltransferase
VTLEDDVVRLRPFEDGDVPAIAAACQDPEIPRWTTVPSPYTEADARAWLESDEEESFAVVDRASGELLGSIGVRYLDDGSGEVGYWVKREARGRGVATRALGLVARWAPLSTRGSGASSSGPTSRMNRRSGWPRRRGSCVRESFCRRSCTRARGAT